MKTQRIVRTIRIVAATGALAAALLGSRVVFAGNPCRAECRQDRVSCANECTEMAGCSNVFATCKERCVNNTFGDERRACVDDCKADRKDCRQFLLDCKVGCQQDFLNCKVGCGS